MSVSNDANVWLTFPEHSNSCASSFPAVVSLLRLSYPHQNSYIPKACVKRQAYTWPFCCMHWLYWALLVQFPPPSLAYHRGSSPGLRPQPWWDPRETFRAASWKLAGVSPQTSSCPTLGMWYKLNYDIILQCFSRYRDRFQNMLGYVSLQASLDFLVTLALMQHHPYSPYPCQGFRSVVAKRVRCTSICWVRITNAMGQTQS